MAKQHTEIRKYDPWDSVTTHPAIMTKGDALRIGLEYIKSSNFVLIGSKTSAKNTASYSGAVTRIFLDNGVLLYADETVGTFEFRHKECLRGVYVSIRDGKPRPFVGVEATYLHKMTPISRAFDTASTFFADPLDSIWDKLMSIDYASTSIRNIKGKMSFLFNDLCPPQIAWSLSGMSIDEVYPVVLRDDFNSLPDDAMPYDALSRSFRIEFASVPVSADPKPFKDFLLKYGRLPLYQSEIQDKTQFVARTWRSPVSDTDIPVMTWHRVGPSMRINIEPKFTTVIFGDKSPTRAFVATNRLDSLRKLPVAHREEGLRLIAESRFLDNPIIETLLAYGTPSIGMCRVIARLTNNGRDARVERNPDNPDILLCHYQNTAGMNVHRCIPMNMPENIFLGWVLAHNELPTRNDLDKLSKNLLNSERSGR